MLTIHHLGVSQSDRIVWLCEELELPYEFVRYERDPETRLAPAEYRALHPFGTAPVITDGPVTLGESAAIIEYVIGRHAPGRLIVAADDPSFPDYLYWLHFANGSMMPSLMVDVMATLAKATLDSTVARGFRDRADRSYAQVEAWLTDNDHFAGDVFTAADIMMLFPLTTMRLFAPRDIGGFPNLKRYLARIGERPAFRRAVARMEPDPPPPLT